MSFTIEALFTAVDRQDRDAFLSHFREDGCFTFGNFPPARGRDEIARSFGDFGTIVKELRHELVEAWRQDGVWIVEQRVHYLDVYGRTHVIPCVNTIRYDGDLITDYRIYADIGPLLTPPEKTTS